MVADAHDQRSAVPASSMMRGALSRHDDRQGRRKGCLARPALLDPFGGPQVACVCVRSFDALLPGSPRSGVGRGGPLPAATLFVSSLGATAPFVFLNTSMGDQAAATARRCGCALEALGWRKHRHTIRSHVKLTAGGMTFIDTGMIRVLEETLPRRFGVGATDYQLVEEEADDGPSLRLLVPPSVGPVDHRPVSVAFQTGIGADSAAGQDGPPVENGALAPGGAASALPARLGKIHHFQAAPSGGITGPS